jgi:hypothetical protein
MGASVQPDTADIQVALWEKGMDDSCFCAHILLYWVGNEGELSMCTDYHNDVHRQFKLKRRQL